MLTREFEKTVSKRVSSRLAEERGALEQNKVNELEMQEAALEEKWTERLKTQEEVRNFDAVSLESKAITIAIVADNQGEFPYRA